MSGNKSESLLTLASKTFKKYSEIESLFPVYAHHPVNLLVNILFENNIFTLSSDPKDPFFIEHKADKSEYIFYLKSFALFSCGKKINIYEYQRSLSCGIARNLSNHLQIIKKLESTPYFYSSSFCLKPVKRAISNYSDNLVTHTLNCTECYKKISQSVDFQDFSKIAASVKKLGFSPQELKLTKSDFDKAIADLEAQIAELKAKYPEFNETPKNVIEIDKQVQYKGVCAFKDKRAKPYGSYIQYNNKKHHISVHFTPEEAAIAYDLKAVELRGEGCTTNFPVEGVKTNVLFPDYPATKRIKSAESVPSHVEAVTEPIQLTITTESNEPEDNPNETVFDRMRAFAIANGIEIKTMKVA